jgi:hypothetical protein
MTILLTIIICGAIGGGIWWAVDRNKKKKLALAEAERRNQLAIAEAGTGLTAVQREEKRDREEVKVHAVRILGKIFYVWAKDDEDDDGYTSDAEMDEVSYELECTGTHDGKPVTHWFEVAEDDEPELFISWKLKGRNILQKLGLSFEKLKEFWNEDEGSFVWDGKTWKYDEDESGDGFFYRNSTGVPESCTAFDFYSVGPNGEELEEGEMLLTVEDWNGERRVRGNSRHVCGGVPARRSRRGRPSSRGAHRATRTLTLTRKAGLYIRPFHLIS